jgi:alpha-glucosidase
MMMLLTLRGTATVYYGDEIGMVDVSIPAERQHDPVAHRIPGEGRDGCRTPMQWDAGPTAGFSPAPAAELWLPLNADHETNNVAAQTNDPTSLLTLTRRIIELRKQVPALHRGSYRSLQGLADGVLGFERESAGESVRVYLNFAAEPRALDPGTGTVLASTEPGRSGMIDPDALAPLEGIVCR